jgi:hypothetical protein
VNRRNHQERHNGDPCPQRQTVGDPARAHATSIQPKYLKINPEMPA